MQISLETNTKTNFHQKECQACLSRYDLNVEPDNFYREQLQLQIPWHKDEIEVLNGNIDPTQAVKKHVSKIRSDSFEFNQLGGDTEFNALSNTVWQLEEEN